MHCLYTQTLSRTVVGKKCRGTTGVCGFMYLYSLLCVAPVVRPVSVLRRSSVLRSSAVQSPN